MAKPLSTNVRKFDPRASKSDDHKIDPEMRASVANRRSQDAQASGETMRRAELRSERRAPGCWTAVCRPRGPASKNTVSANAPRFVSRAVSVGEDYSVSSFPNGVGGC
jgi:hypothetical protein